jgi:hypothetical protein
MTDGVKVIWKDPGSTLRQATLTFDATNASAMQVDEGVDGSVDRSVAAKSVAFLDNPHGVSVVKLRPTSARVSWNAVNGAARYQVYYGPESRYMPLFYEYAKSADAGNNTSVDLSGLALDAEAYYFTVTAVDAAENESMYGAEALLPEAWRQKMFLPFLFRR